MPTIDHLYALSELIQVPMDDLICGNRVMTKRCDIGTEPGIERFLAYYNKTYGKDRYRYKISISTQIITGAEQTRTKKQKPRAKRSKRDTFV